MMNKYQEFLLQNIRFYLISSSICDSNKNFEVKYSDNILTIKQLSDITVTNGCVFVMGNGIDSVFAVNGATEVAWEDTSDKRYTIKKINFDFNDTFESVRIKFANDIADDVIIPVKFIEADKEVYYAKKAKEARDALIKAAQVKHAMGSDLINIYFQPCSNNYSKTVIFLYRENQLMAKYKVDEDEFFKSISGLAYGTYTYELAQYDTAGTEIIKTDMITFKISKPNYGGKPIIFPK